MAAQLAYGLSILNDRLISIEEVQRGKTCACVCPGCKEPLLARKGEKNDWHFAHSSGKECQWAPETALHLLCKQIITDQLYIRLPNGRNFWYTAAQKEKTFSHLRADAWIQSSTQEWVIEIFVTHEVTPRKHAFIRSQDISAFEIDVSKVPRDISFEALRELIIDGLDGKSFLHEKKEEMESAPSSYKTSHFLKNLLSVAAVVGFVYVIYRIICSLKKKRYMFR